MMPPVSLLLLLLPLVSAQTFQWGPCPQPKVHSNFSLEQYLGEWYEIEKLPCMYGEGKCVEAKFEPTGDGSAHVVFRETVDNKVEMMEGMMYQGADEPARLGIKYYYIFPKSPWWVLYTDYSSVSVVYSCQSILDIFHLDNAWIISRTRSLHPGVVKKARDIFVQEKIDISKMIVTDQTGCEV